jgi:hypothetical protein
MMLLLHLDVMDGFVQLRNTHAECAVLNLPAEEAMFGECVVYPFGGTALDELERFGYRERGRQREQDMDVVRHPVNFTGLHFILPGDASDKWPESFP